MQGFVSSSPSSVSEHLLSVSSKFSVPRVAIARANASLPMMAAKEGFEAGLMIPVFVGEKDEIFKEAEALEWDISGFDVYNAVGESVSAHVAARLCGDGKADVLMKGQLHSDIFMRGAVGRENGLRTGKRFVHMFYITPSNGGNSVIVTDAAVNVSPNIETKKVAIEESVKLCNKLGNSAPRVAFLSATESEISSVPSSVEAGELARWASENFEEGFFSGPLALDLILSEESARIKGIDDPVCGNADIIVVPDIVSGNVLFKSLVYMGGGCAAGIVVGGKVPILLTSRADSTVARKSSMALAKIKAGLPLAL